MVERVHHESAKATTGAKTSAPSTGGVSFAEVHAAAVKTTSAASASAATDPSITQASPETWKPVAGALDYAKITAGPRTGQYIDLSRGARHGDAFTLEQRDGKTMRVYKTADGTEDVVAAPAHHIKPRNADETPGKGETWGPVKGHSSYADILGGPRDGLFVNLSGGPRTGQAFQLVRRGNEMLHIYGEGKDRQVFAVPVHHHDHSAPASKHTTPATKHTTPATKKS